MKGFIKKNLGGDVNRTCVYSRRILLEGFLIKDKFDMNVYRRFSIPKMELNLLVIFGHIFCDVGFRSHHPYFQTKLDSRGPHESQMHLRTVWLIFLHEDETWSHEQEEHVGKYSLYGAFGNRPPQTIPENVTK